MGSFSFGDPGLSNNNTSFSDVFDEILLPTANLAANTFIANQAVTSKQASSVSFLPNGQISVAAGGGAGTALGTGALGSSSFLLIAFGLLLFVLLLKR